MVLAEYKPPRSQLLQWRRTRRIAERGHRLLKLKRDALIVEFFRVLERAKTLRSHLADKYRVAEQRIAIARAIEGSIGVRSAALASKEVPTLQLKTKNVMGIIVPKIDAKSVRKKLEQRGYGIVTTSARIDEAAEAYEALVEDIVVAAEIETTMRRLIEEIEKVKRRGDAPQDRVIPELKSTAGVIRPTPGGEGGGKLLPPQRVKGTGWGAPPPPGGGPPPRELAAHRGTRPEYTAAR